MTARPARGRPGWRAVAMLLAALLGGIAVAPTAQAADDTRTAAEIAHLLDYVGTSGCTFIRNGEPHPAAEARDHLAMKYGRGRAWVGSADQFVERIATRSFLSGDIYRVQCPGQSAQPTGPWLASELRRWRMSHP